MKRTIFFCWFYFTATLVFSQVNQIDSLRTVISLGREDSAEVSALLAASNYFSNKQIDSQVQYAEKGLFLTQKINYQKGEADFLLYRGATAFDVGSRSQGLAYLFRALVMYEELKNEDGMAAIHLMLQGAYREVGDYKNSLSHAEIVRKLVEPTNRIGTIVFQGISMTPLILAEIGGTYEVMGVLDSARYFTQAAINKKLIFNGAAWSFPFEVYGRILAKEGNYDQALSYYRNAIPLAIQNGNFKDTLDIYNDIAILYKKNGQLDSAVYYAEKIITQSNFISQLGIILQATVTIAEVYKLKGNKDSALKYIEQSVKLKEQVFSQREQVEFQNQTLNEVLRKQELIREKLKYQNNIRYLLLLAGLFAFALTAFYLFRINQNRKKAFHILEEQKIQTELQREKAEQAFLQLQSAQAQLIQSEKMASLGELTAGIAHEIQNPLNFVNNFSEVNAELSDEILEAANRGDLLEIKVLAADIKSNQQKIREHGKRADSIVKGMLQHSRTSSGEKQETDINALVDEYLRLAYHGLRAKDKIFNATLKTELDPAIGKVNIVSQDIGRVLLNLYNNAFYAVNEKMKSAPNSYEPQVSVSTSLVPASENSLIRQSANSLIILVKDNGNGIPEKVLDKVFQPFFTTKPTGQGTGLGLSLSYDIVKAHGGEMTVETNEGEGTVFKIKLPKE